VLFFLTFSQNSKDKNVTPWIKHRNSLGAFKK
jgi:hypothetical protein